MPWIFIVWLIYGLFSMVLSLCTLYCLYKWKEFESPYFGLVRCGLIIHIIVYLHSWFKRISTNEEVSGILLPLVTEFEWILKVNDFLSHYFYHVQSGSLLLKCTFRYFATTEMLSESFWKSNNYLIHLGVFVMAGIVTSPYYFVSGLKSVTYNATTNSLVYNPNIWGSAVWIMRVQCVLYVFLILVLGFLTNRKINSDWSKAKVIRRRIRIINITGMIIHAIVGLMYLLPTVMEISISTRTAMLFSISDLITCTTPYTLMLVNPLFREAVCVKVFKCQPSRGAQPSTVRAFSLPDPLAGI